MAHQGLYDNTQLLRSARALWKSVLSFEILILTLHSFCDFQPDTFLGSILKGLQSGYIHSVPIPHKQHQACSQYFGWAWLPMSGDVQLPGCKNSTLSESMSCLIHIVSQKHSAKRVRTGAEVYLFVFHWNQILGQKCSRDVWRVSFDNVALYFHSCQWGMQKPGYPTAGSYMSYTGYPSVPSWWLALFRFKVSAYMLSAWNAHYAGFPTCPLCLDKSHSSSKDLDESLIVATTFPL